MKLHEKLEKLERYPFHMPGHKRNPEFNITGSEIDITEIDGFDNLHNAKGVIAEVEERLKRHYKSKKSFMLVNGSTVGILAAVFAVCNEGDKIIIARNCHKSVYNACLLRHLKVVYLEPEFDSVNMCYTSVMQDRVDSLLLNHADAKAVVITSPTYEGRISNIEADIPLIIDAAHGAHLGLDCFPAYPKGSIVISSLHKTLPALTQTAVMNIYCEEYTAKAKRYLDIFETSSPSYVLMSSVSKCCDIIENAELFRDYYKRLTDFRQIEFSSLHLKYSDDISKIVISTQNTVMSGKGLAEILRKNLIEPEMVSENYVVLMTSVADTQEGFDRLTKALLEADEGLMQKDEPPRRKPPIPKGVQVIEYPESTQE
ncbi:MAG: aminotransferase class I/II-fold pyridoxal phosphate-dependent enzyme [Eubacterium sp.]|nr:aminotransferase class I/II-fold pyridoxal phosphate-dependent enzyme [Eubacterium sp.]